MAPLQPNPLGSISAQQLDEFVDNSTRGRLIRATIELFTEGGYEATRVQRIARRAGLTTGAIYANFASKEALLSEAIGQASLAALQGSVVEVARDLTAVQVLHLLATEALGTPRQPNHAMIMQGLAGATRDVQLHETMIAPIRALDDTIRALLMQAREEGAISADANLDALAWLALTITMGSFVMKSLALPIPAAPAIEDMVQRLLGGFEPSP